MVELRTKLEISSSWESSALLQRVLYLSSRSGSGYVLDEPVQAERCPSLVLSQVAGGSDEDSGCYIHIRRLAGLCSYTLCGVGLVSGARVVEVYGGEDYIATSKGTDSGHDSQIGKLYECCLKLDQSCVYDHLALKLLSLRGKTTVPVSRLTLTLAEDHGGESTVVARTQEMPQKTTDLHGLIGSLPLPSNAPPFIQGLVSSLHQWQQSGETPPAANPHPSSSSKPESLDLLQMMSALRQLRPASHDTPESSTSEPHEQEATRGAQGAGRNSTDPVNCSIEAFVEQKMGELEERMRSYIDGKVAEIMKHIEVKLEENRHVEVLNTDHEHSLTQEEK